MSILEFMESYEPGCTFNPDVTCKLDGCSEKCEHFIAMEDRRNFNNPPMPPKWETITGDDLFPVCPACREYNDSDICYFCGQHITPDERLIDYREPPDEVRMDCICCKTKDAMVGYRSKVNGHFNGECEVCGARIIE